MLCVVTGCTLGPSSRPDLAVQGAPGPERTATSTPSVPPGPGGPGQNAEFDARWRSCNDLADPVPGAAAFTTECTGVSVPLDYAHPEQGSLTLAVGRSRAAGLTEDAPSLVVMPAAGPYEATLAGVRRIANVAAGLPGQITARFQIVGIDVRGTGRSSSENCWRDYPLEYLYTMDADLTNAAAAPQLADVTRAFTFGCQDHVGPEMVYFGTTQTADDLDSLRSALHEETLDYLGEGYGATVGGVYAMRYPHRVGRLVLDSPTDHSASPTARAQTAAVQFERSLQAFVSDCAARPTCALGTAPADTVAAAIAGLTYDPGSTAGNATGDTGLGSGAVLWAMMMALPDRSRWPGLAAALGDVADGDPSNLVDLLDSLSSSPNADLSTRMMIDCNDSAERVADSDLSIEFGTAREVAPTFGSFLVGVASLCRQWPSPEAPLSALRAPGAAPILVIGGVNDPVAPYLGTQAVAAQLTSATLISYLGLDHGGYEHSECISAAVDGYLLDGAIPAGATLCPA